ncbi:hypothetical protein K1X76_06510 [bacterium]|nr:hypothetical protein [bacterium]
MSLGYVFVLPFVVGIIAVFYSSKPIRIWSALFLPWIPMCFLLLFALLVGWEGSICLIMAACIHLPLASIGGLVGWLARVFKNSHGRLATVMMGFFLVAPASSALVENQLVLPTKERIVKTEISIEAKRDVIWQHIIRVQKIDEPITGFFYTMGFPKPIEADLSFEGLGGVRRALFDKGLFFTETITEWKNKEVIAFSIKADPNATPLTTLDAHVVPGGRYFDVLEGKYEIEMIDESHAILHLQSRYEVSTFFNFYAQLWGDFLMRDVQNSILKVIKNRCENKGQS